MTLKKMMLLAGMAFAAIAFAIPATASALPKTDGTHWTNGNQHKIVNNGVSISAPFEGFLDFTTPMPPAPVHSTFGCEVTAIIKVTGPTTAEATKFEPTTTTCVGTGIFAGCKLKAHTNNLPWTVTNTTGNTSAVPPTVSDFDVTKVGGTGDVTIRNEYESCTAGAIPPSDPEFKSITVTPTLDGNGTVTSFSISGTATDGATIATGSLSAEAVGTKIGVKTVEVID
jgi:hypothetical protein